MSIERISLSAAAAVIAAARRSAADHARARRVGPPQYRVELDSQIRDAESSARAARITEQLAELQERRRLGGSCASGCAGSCHQGRQPCEHRSHVERRTHRAAVVDFAPTEPFDADGMGYEAGDHATLPDGRTASAAWNSPDVLHAARIERIKHRLVDAAYWACVALAVASAYAMARN